MTHYCAHRNALEILSPLVALRRVREGGQLLHELPVLAH